MAIMSRVWDFLGSRNLSVYIFVTALTYVLLLVMFSVLVPAWWVNNISRLLPFKVLYVAFFVNLIVCEIKWIPVVIRRCKRPEPPETEDEMKRFRHTMEVRDTESGIRDLEKYLRKRWYSVRLWEESQASGAPVSPVVLHASCGRFSPLGSIMFHMSFLLLLGGGLLSMISHFEKNLLLMAGQSTDDGFEVLDIKPEFWGNRLLFTDLVARIRSEGGDYEARLSSAAHIGGGRRVTIQGISYTPKYVLRESSGKVVDIGYVNLVNFVPGSVDNFSIPSFPYKIYVSIYPDYEIKEGEIKTKSMNLINPRYMVRITRGKVLIYSGLLGMEDEAFFDGYKISFPEIKFNGSFRLILDKGEPLIWTGLMFMGCGLIWRLLFFRREVAVSVAGGKVCLYLNSDYYPALLLRRCTAILEAGPRPLNVERSDLGDSGHDE